MRPAEASTGVTISPTTGGRVPGPLRTLVLVHPPQQDLMEGFSSGLVALANHVTERLPSVDVHLLDLGLADVDEAEEQINTFLRRETRQIFVGISTTSATYQSALRVAKIFKRLRKDCIVVLGGHHASAQSEVIVKHHSFVDCVIRGEGEAPLVELLRKYPRLDQVPNVTYLDGIVVRNIKSVPLLTQSELDAIPPMFRGWGLRSGPGKFGHTTYVSARGCPLGCAFCAVGKQRVRSKSVEAVIVDLRVLVGELGYTSIAIEDNFFAHSPKRTIELCAALEVLQREMPFRWDCQTRVESCKPHDVLQAMERAGCEAVYLGVEAFDPEHLLYLRKTRAPGTYLNVLREQVVPWLLRSRIDCYINLQLALPAEGPSHRENTSRFLRLLGKEALSHGKTITLFPQLHVVYPGTRHFHEGLAEGRYGPDGESVFERFTEWEARHQPIVQWLGEHFAHGAGGIPEGILMTDRLRHGDFELDTMAVLEVTNYLHAISNVPGIRVFEYGRHLARPNHRDENFMPTGATM